MKCKSAECHCHVIHADGLCEQCWRRIVWARQFQRKLVVTSRPQYGTLDSLLEHERVKQEIRAIDKDYSRGGFSSTMRHARR
jgi:hypothetical protein